MYNLSLVLFLSWLRVPALALITAGVPMLAIGATHEGAAAASHMQLKDSDGSVVCYVYDNIPASSRPVATGCPVGTFTEQLFDTDWGQIGDNREVTVVDSNTGGPSAGDNNVLLRNPDTQAKFSQQQNTRSDSLIVADLTDITDEYDDGPTYIDGAKGDGNFRVSCQWSHFSKDDPIVYPNEEGKSHLHMFFGNTEANASTTTGLELVESGGGTCNGFALNRSAYWVPALLNESNEVIVPKTIFVYYKTRVICPGGHKVDPNSDEDNYRCIKNDGSPAEYPMPLWEPDDVSNMPQGLQLLGGPTPFTPSANLHQVFWSCGKNGNRVRDTKSDQIPTKEQCGTYTETVNGAVTTVHRPLNATIYFPQCWNRTKGMKYDPNRSEHEQHVKRVEEWEACPANGQGDDWVRLPQLGVLLYWDLEEVESTAGWRLASDLDMEGNLVKPRGSSLHSDWIGGWHNATQDDWINSCLKNERNCTLGQTGTSRKLKRALNGGSGEDANNDSWIGPRIYTIPGI